MLPYLSISHDGFGQIVTPKYGPSIFLNMYWEYISTFLCPIFLRIHGACLSEFFRVYMRIKNHENYFSFFKDFLKCTSLLLFFNCYFMSFNLPRIKYTYFQHKYVIQQKILKHLYLNIFLYFQLIHADWKIQVFSMRTLDGRKDIQSVKSPWSICIQSLKPASYPVSREMTKSVKRTRYFPLFRITILN